MADEPTSPAPEPPAPGPFDDAAAVEAAVDRLNASVQDLRLDVQREMETAEERHNEQLAIQERKIERADKAIRRTRYMGVGLVVLIILGAIGLVDNRRQSQDIINDREIARLNSCLTWNDLIDAIHASTHGQTETLIRVTEPSSERLAQMTPEEVTRRQEIVQSYREGVEAGLAGAKHRDCSPEGLRRFHEERMALTR